MNRLPLILLGLPATRSLHTTPIRHTNIRSLTLLRSVSSCNPYTTRLSSSSSAMVIPSPPLQYEATMSSFNLDGLSKLTAEMEEQRQGGYDLSRKIHIALVQARHAVETNQPNHHEAFEKLDVYMQQVVQQQSKDRAPRLANLSMRMEDVVRIQAFQHFLKTGQLLPPSSITSATDEEYLAGACMGLAQDLQRYGLGRATARDVDSVKAACDLVRDILDYLLGFDFRNGPLRRKYDGTKYALKGLETLLYELAVTGAVKAADANEPETKRPRTADDASLLPTDELNNIRKRMEHRDELRESLIKKSRDGQKAAKQAIYALHRGDKKRALDLLTECHSCITKQLQPIVDEEPPLRAGSYANVLEEYAEAKLFACWLYGEDETGQAASISGHILKPEDFDIHLEPEEYLGGLCDLTGEVGRYAVQCGTSRDVDGVKRCLQTNRDIQTSIESMERIPGNINKKMEQLRRSVEKLERMLYELSLSEAVGRSIKSDLEDAEMEEEH